jgi:hypothetical protein
MAWLVKNQGLADIHLFVPGVMDDQETSLYLTVTRWDIKQKVQIPSIR